MADVTQEVAQNGSENGAAAEVPAVTDSTTQEGSTEAAGEDKNQNQEEMKETSEEAGDSSTAPDGSNKGENNGEEESESAKEEKKTNLILRCRGLPWSATESDLRKFFGDQADAVISVHFTYNWEGRPNGEAYAVFADEDNFREAKKRDHEKIGHRYIELFEVDQEELNTAIETKGRKSREAGDGNNEGVVRMRGLPFGCSKEEISTFFKGLEVVKSGIVIPYDQNNRHTGEAFVQFVDTETAEKGLEKHMQHMGSRYIEVFRSSTDELQSVMRRLSSNEDRYAEPRWESPWSRGSPFGNMMSGGMGGGGGGGGGGGYGRRQGPYNYQNSQGGYIGSFGNSGGGDDMGSWGGNGNGNWNNGGGYGGGGGGGSIGDMFGGGGSGGGGGGYGRSGGGPIRTTGGQGSRSAGGMRGFGGGGGGSWGSLPGRGGGGGGGGGFSPGSDSQQHIVKMRGLPFSCTQEDVEQFFAPVRIRRVELLREFKKNRPSGEALVEFFTHSDASRAMSNDKKNIGNRYIELFLESGGR